MMEDKPKPAGRMPPYKALLAKQYMAVEALADPDDPKVQAYLAHLEKVLTSAD